MRRVLFLFFLLYSSIALAWDATGHRLIAQIAYDNLTPAAKVKIDQLTKILDEKYSPSGRFLYAAVWPDLLKNDGVMAFNAWHFIDYPYSPDQTPTQPYRQDNIVWAIQQSEQVLQNTSANVYEKTVFLRFLLHLVGDAHQPLHCINRYSRAFPNGDMSGNLVLIKDPYALNLHMYWDEGLGFFRRYGNRYPLPGREIKRLAKKVEQDYPPEYFKGQVTDLNPWNWSKQCYQIAVNFAYNVRDNSQPSVSYTTQGQRIAEQQVALAGYRLANLLNQLYP